MSTILQITILDNLLFFPSLLCPNTLKYKKKSVKTCRSYLNSSISFITIFVRAIVVSVSLVGTEYLILFFFYQSVCVFVKWEWWWCGQIWDKFVKKKRIRKIYLSTVTSVQSVCVWKLCWMTMSLNESKKTPLEQLTEWTESNVKSILYDSGFANAVDINTLAWNIEHWVV